MELSPLLFSRLPLSSCEEPADVVEKHLLDSKVVKGCMEKMSSTN